MSVLSLYWIILKLFNYKFGIIELFSNKYINKIDALSVKDELWNIRSDVGN